MKKSDEVDVVADLVIYAMEQIQMAKLERKMTGEIKYWNGEIMSMKYLLLYIDKRLGKKEKSDKNLPDLKSVFDLVDDKRKEKFNSLSNIIWEDD
jgi:hypothetical protein